MPILVELDLSNTYICQKNVMFSNFFAINSDLVASCNPIKSQLLLSCSIKFDIFSWHIVIFLLFCDGGHSYFIKLDPLILPKFASHEIL